ncbi:MAG TPA: right-handed parallel beta-helix repeat-containing protein [Pirellulaceae bacterium]|nr:right-handed parallel beta-helix repeat-containing protein [Pirellulaceae bacterium]
MSRLIFALALLLTWAQPVAARDWFVNNVAGDDLKDGNAEVSTSTSAGPVRTITKALHRAGHYDRIIIANTGEPYRESITLCGRHSGSPELPFTIVGNGAVLDGSRPVLDDAWEFHRGDLFRFQPRGLTSQMLFYQGKPLARAGSTVTNGRLPKLEPLQWRYLDGYIYFRPPDNYLPQQYHLTLAAQTVGITLYQVMHVEIQDLVVQGYQLDGVNAHDSAFGVKLIGLTCRGNGRSGISIGGASQVMLEACLVSSNGEAQVRTEGYSHTELVNCTLLDATAPAIVKEDHSEVKEIEVP